LPRGDRTGVGVGPGGTESVRASRERGQRPGGDGGRLGECARLAPGAGRASDDAAGNFVTSTFVHDAFNSSADNIAASGPLDTEDFSQWFWESGKPQGKNDIEDAYAAAYTANGSQFVYVGADRFDNAGSSVLGFWLLQNNVSMHGGVGGVCGTLCEFTGVHKDGDLLFIFDAQAAGGPAVEAEAFEWSNGALTQIGSVGCLGSCTALGNTGTVTAPWPFTAKDGTSGSFPIGHFFEGGIMSAR
jgi:hypothetical protein